MRPTRASLQPAGPASNPAPAVINTVQGFQKVRNVERGSQVAVCVADPADSNRYFAIRGRVVRVTTLISFTLARQVLPAL
jgi:hypothetical protein